MYRLCYNNIMLAEIVFILCGISALPATLYTSLQVFFEFPNLLMLEIFFFGNLQKGLL